MYIVQLYKNLKFPCLKLEPILAWGKRVSIGFIASVRKSFLWVVAQVQKSFLWVVVQVKKLFLWVVGGTEKFMSVGKKIKSVGWGSRQKFIPVGRGGAGKFMSVGRRGK